MKSTILKLLLPLCAVFLLATQAQAAAYHRVLCEVDQWSIRVLGEIPDGPLKYIVFNYSTENTTIVPNGDYSADNNFHYYDFILHAPPQDTIVELAARKNNTGIVWLKVWEQGNVIYNKKCDFGKRLVTY